MKKWVKNIFYALLIILVVCICLLHLVSNYVSYDDKDIISMIPNSEVQYHDAIRSVGVNNNSDTLLVFIHGAPGDFSAFEKFLMDKDYKSFNLLSYDRPGYGSSPVSPMVRIKDQANSLLNIIKQHDHKHIVLIGHSYGCAIAGYLGSIYPDIIDKVIMIAPLISPEDEPIFWFSYIGKWPITKWLLTTDLQTCGAEKFAHAEALMEISDSWSIIEIPILHIHGMKDYLAPPDPNIEYSKSNIPSKYLNLKLYQNEGHLILWDQYELISNEILNFIN